MSATAVPIRPIKKGSVLKLWIGLAVLAAIAAAAAWLGTESQQYQTTASGLQYRVIKEGSGPHPNPSDLVLIDYDGRLADGKVFDSTKGKQPAAMGVTGTIPGFSEGLQLMRKGGSYRLRIPPQLGYGAEEKKNQAGEIIIPANSTLVFDVTLHEFMNMAQLQGMMGSMQGGMPGGAPGEMPGVPMPPQPGQ
jgi:FKBP-type peptidyl-prolyl cis-trans isomerase FkpA